MNSQPTDRLAQLLNFYEQDPDDTFVAFAIALEYNSLGNYERARKMFELIYEKNPSYVALYYQYGRLMEKLGQVELAQKLYEEGMHYAEKQGEVRTRAELFAALQDLLER